MDVRSDSIAVLEQAEDQAVAAAKVERERRFFRRKIQERLGGCVAAPARP